MQVAVPMTATSKQEPPIPADDPVSEVMADEGVETEAQQSARRSKKPVTASVPTVASVAPVVEAKAAKAKPAMQPNNVRKLRQAAMMSKAELARRAGVSPLTIDRVESGCPCRMDTKRKILEALGLKPEAREQVFGPDIDQG